MTYHLSDTQIYVLVILALWELIWKGLALWKAAKRRQPVWFVVILVINSAGILPIIYLLLNKDDAADKKKPGA
jgi:peptidoglycan/LPS O-acetylase OafA/YrhL